MDLTEVLSIISAAFTLPETPLAPLPPPLVISGGSIRSGISARTIASRIISRQSDAGAPVGDLPDGSQNISEAMEVIRVEEILYALQIEAKIEVVLPPGISVSTMGVGNLGAPVISQGATTGPANGFAILR
jgi:hypothetical protein